MLLLCFSLGDERFAIPASIVREIVPRVRLAHIPRAPSWVAGVMCYHGQMLPVIDLCMLHLARPTRPYMSSRIILVAFGTTNGSEHVLGLLAEQVTETLQRQPVDFQPTHVDTPETAHLKGVAQDKQGMLQLMDADCLLPEDVRQALFQQIQDIDA